MTRRYNNADRDHAIRKVKHGTAGAIGAALGLTGVFSVAAVITFSGQPVAATRPLAPPPSVPKAKAPVQAAPPTPVVVQHIVHHAAAARIVASYASSPRPPQRGPAPAGGGSFPAPPPPPPPACHSTPSHPC